jgi:hypothetical protein
MRPTARILPAAVATAALLAATAACAGSAEPRDPAADPAGSQAGSGADPASPAAAEAVRAAAESTEEITSADFDAVVSSPDAAGGEVTMTGSLSWADELAMDVTLDGEATAPGMPDEVSAVWLDGVMYPEMGEDFGAGFDGRDWLRMDLANIARETGDESLVDVMSFGLERADQDPREQLDLLLGSPDLERLGEETLDGATVEHYRGTIAPEDAPSGTEEYLIDVWVDEDDFPVRIRQSYETDEGPVESEVTYRDLGTEVAVEPPPEDSVIDFMDLLGAMESGF